MIPLIILCLLYAVIIFLLVFVNDITEDSLGNFFLALFFSVVVGASLFASYNAGLTSNKSKPPTKDEVSVKWKDIQMDSSCSDTVFFHGKMLIKK